MIITTVSSAGHLPRAMILAKSIKEHMPACTVVVGLMEDSIPMEAAAFPYFDEIVLLKHLNVYGNFLKFIFQYRPKEAAGSSKGQILKYVYEKYTAENHFVYLDTDMKLYSSLDEIEDALRDHSIIITSHHNESPEPFDLTKMRIFKYYGIFNTGFLAVKRNNIAQSFIDWWVRRLETEGYISLQKGIFTDQTWVDFVPALFDDVYCLRHAGYNIGPWNFYERRNINVDASGKYTVDSAPLRLFHYSGINDHFVSQMNHLPVAYQPMIRKLRHDYLAELEAMGQSTLGRREWSYDRFYNGTPISLRTRVNYRNKHYRNTRITNPFTLSNSYFGGGKQAGKKTGRRVVKGQKRRAGRVTTIRSGRAGAKRSKALKRAK